MHHDLHQHLLVGQETVQVQTLALHSLGIGQISSVLLYNERSKSHRGWGMSPVAYRKNWEVIDVMAFRLNKLYLQSQLLRLNRERSPFTFTFNNNKVPQDGANTLFGFAWAQKQGLAKVFCK